MADPRRGKLLKLKVKRVIHWLLLLVPLLAISLRCGLVFLHFRPQSILSEKERSSSFYLGVQSMANWIELLTRSKEQFLLLLRSNGIIPRK